MSEITINEALADSEKPVQVSGNGQFPPFPVPTDEDFEDDIPEDERTYYKTKFNDLNNVTSMKVHCSACDRHLGLTPKNSQRMRTHPMLRTLICQSCHSFYNSGEFEKGDDGSELYCRWCGQGGQVYCCSECPHVFCAKCIKRNLGPSKIKEIEALDDWRCFKCNNTCLKDLRAICWAALRYCDIKTRLANDVKDSAQKEACLQDCAQDHSECCKNKARKREKVDVKKKESETRKSTGASASSIISKIPPTIQVKKFASINMGEVNKSETKKAVKRAASPKHKPYILKNPITVASKPVNTFNVSPMTKKMRICMPPAPVMNPIRIMHDRKQTNTPNSFLKIRPKSQMVYNGMNVGNSFNNVITNDNINLSIESLTQGLDMAAMSNMPGGSQDDELVCTPDFPIEPLCEVTEDNTDDDVQCITPAPVAAPKGPPPLISFGSKDLSDNNIVQMTENDVTVNSVTGGLKFRVDPQTLSANKMYRLPDGRIFAINANPNMPGGYSATIVAVTESNPNKSSGNTYAVKLNHVSNRSTVSTSTPRSLNNSRNTASSRNNQRQRKTTKRSIDTPTRETDLHVPVEWYRYNLVDAIDALEYSLSRLNKLKKEATTSYLRTRTVQEMRTLHRSLENLLNTSSQRFKEIRENINKELKQYITRKNTPIQNNSEEDDDDVEILPDMEEDPIFIDENSLDSSTNETQEVDLTGAGSSEHNDSEDKILKECLSGSTDNDANNQQSESYAVQDKSTTASKDNSIPKDPEVNNVEPEANNVEPEEVETPKSSTEDNVNCNEETTELAEPAEVTNASKDDKVCEKENDKCETQQDSINNDTKKIDDDESSKVDHISESDQTSNKDDKTQIENGDHNMESEGKGQDIDISDEMIDDLLKGDSQENSDAHEICSLEISDEIKDQ
ncbi:uncharacterized protein LOC123691832 [Colias croceus]|uniref:uncharacterized protein LOC123691832 n=1 Tax=Colias crocea TaxID=72248 RepID=UPI001E27EA00|nr:uncharacterized protein LOC123691832 [Colias croceus]